MKKFKLNAFQKKWLEALESGKYKQTKEKLFSGKGYCCLGVACDLAKIKPEKTDGGIYKFDGEWDVAPQKVIDLLNLRGDCGELDRTTEGLDSLAEMNDRGKKFKTIARFIRKNPEKVFLFND